MLASRSLLLKIFAVNGSLDIHHRLFIWASILITHFWDDIGNWIFVIIIIAEDRLDWGVMSINALLFCLESWNLSRTLWLIRRIFIDTLKQGLMRLLWLHWKDRSNRALEFFRFSFFRKLGIIHTSVNYFRSEEAWVIIRIFINFPMSNWFTIKASYTRSEGWSKYVILGRMFRVFSHYFIHDILEVCAWHWKTLGSFHILWRRRKAKTLLFYEFAYHCWIISRQDYVRTQV